jgi:hypothetical protein
MTTRLFAPLAAALTLLAPALAQADVLLDQGTMPNGNGRAVGGSADFIIFQPFAVPAGGNWHLTSIALDGWRSSGDTAIVQVRDTPDGAILATTSITLIETTGQYSDFQRGPVDVQLPGGANGATFYLRISIATPGDLLALFLGSGDVGLPSTTRFNSGFEVTAPPIALILEGTAGGAPCRADIDGSGIVNVQDFLAYLQLYSAADPRADMDNNGQINVGDFLAFLALYAAGC